jgi:transketolase
MAKKIDKKRKAAIKKVEKKANAMRCHIIAMLCKAGSGHPGGSLSATDLIASLYFYKMKYDPKDPSMPDRDKFLLCKGHACPAQYAAMAEAVISLWNS